MAYDYQSNTGLLDSVVEDVLDGMLTEILINDIYVANVPTQYCYERDDSMQNVKNIVCEILKRYAPDGDIKKGLERIYREDSHMPPQQTLGFYVTTIIDLDWMLDHGPDRANRLYGKHVGQKWMIRNI